MRIVATTHPTAKISSRCKFCGDIIEKGTKYTYVKYSKGSKLTALKTHDECLFLAKRINPDDISALSSFTFDRKVRAEAKNLLTETKKRAKEAEAKSLSVSVLNQFQHGLNAKDINVSVSALGKKPIKWAVSVVHSYVIGEAEYREKVKEIATRQDKAILKDFIVVCSMLMMMPNLFDDLFDCIKAEKAKKQAIKNTFGKALIDFEKMGNSLYAKFTGGAESSAHKMCDSGMAMYSAFQDNITLEGVEKASNILWFAMELAIDKMSAINRTHKAQDILDNLKRNKSLAFKHIEFTKQPAVKAIMAQFCSTDNIQVTD